MAIDVGHDDDDVGPFDQREERITPAAGEMTRVALDAVPALTRELPVQGCVPIDAADESDVHGLISADFEPASAGTICL